MQVGANARYRRLRPLILARPRTFRSTHGRRAQVRRLPRTENPVIGALDRAATAVADAVAPRLGATSWATAESGYRQLLEALGVAVYTTDADGRITYFNDAAAAFWGRRPELGELWCGSYKLFWPDGAPMAHAECPMAIALLEGRRAARRRGHRRAPGRHAASAFTPYPTVMRDPDGPVVGAVNVLVDISDRKHAEDAVRATAEALRARTPSRTSSSGWCRTSCGRRSRRSSATRGCCATGATGSPMTDRDSMVGDIAGEAERLLGVVENLLLLTKLESGIHPDPEPQVLAHVDQAVVESFQRRHPDRRRSRLTSEPRHLIVEADRPYLDLILENLLSNAAQVQPGRQSPIEVVVRATDAEAQVLVLDRGIGLDGADPELALHRLLSDRCGPQPVIGAWHRARRVPPGHPEPRRPDLGRAARRRRRRVRVRAAARLDAPGQACASRLASVRRASRPSPGHPGSA